jgi:hypothetical protein
MTHCPTAAIACAHLRIFSCCTPRFRSAASVAATPNPPKSRTGVSQTRKAAVSRDVHPRLSIKMVGVYELIVYPRLPEAILHHRAAITAGSRKMARLNAELTGGGATAAASDATAGWWCFVWLPSLTALPRF